MQPAAVNLRGPFAALVSFQAQVSVLGVQQGRRKEWGEGVGVVPVATHQHASPLGSHYPRWPSVLWFYKADTLTTLLAMAGMFVLGPGLAGGGRLSPSGVSAGGVGMLMMAVVMWDALQFGLSPSSAFKLRLERLG